MEDELSEDRISLWLMKRDLGESLVIVSDPELPRTRAIKLIIDWVQNDRATPSPKVRRLELSPLEDLFLTNVAQLENSTYRDSVGRLLWEYSSPTVRSKNESGFMLAKLRELEESLFSKGLVDVDELAR